MLIPLAVHFCYVMIESWCLSYAWSYAIGGIGIEATQPEAEPPAIERALEPKEAYFGAPQEGAAASEGTG